MKVPFVHSNFERKSNDHYPTIDSRCVDAALQTINLEGTIVDICAKDGSAIVDYLHKIGRLDSYGLDNAFAYPDFQTDNILTNPPYDRNVVDSFVEFAISAIETGRVDKALFLMRSNWDFAKSRAHLFNNPFYRGQIKMRFRPWWSEERTAQPIHNYVWHIWDSKHIGQPNLFYWPKQNHLHFQSK